MVKFSFNFKSFIIGLGIFILFALVLWQGIQVFYPYSEYTQFCREIKSQELINSSEQCVAVGGQWNPYNDPYSEVKPIGYCDQDFTCRKSFEEAEKNHSEYVFLISILVGILCLIIGFLIINIEPVGSSLLASGIWAIFYGTVVNWRNFTELWRFLLLVFALGLLIFFGVKLSSKK